MKANKLKSKALFLSGSGFDKLGTSPGLVHSHNKSTTKKEKKRKYLYFTICSDSAIYVNSKISYDENK